MKITIGEIIIWLIVGGFAGAIVGAVVKRSREGYGRWKNLGIGLTGAVIGGLIFNTFQIQVFPTALKITFDDLLAALLGSFLLLGVISFVRKKKGR